MACVASGALSPRRPNAAGMRPVACGTHGPPPAPIPRSRASSSSDAWNRTPDMLLGFAKYALFFLIYICLSFSLSLLFRQSRLYDSQFNFSIRTRLISTGYEPSAFSSLGSTSNCCISSEAPPAIKVSYFDLVHLEPTILSSVGIDAYY